MANTNAQVMAAIARIEREVVALQAQVRALGGVPVGAPATPVASAPVAPAPVAQATVDPAMFAASGATLRTLAAAGDAAAQAEIDRRAANKAAKAAK